MAAAGLGGRGQRQEEQEIVHSNQALDVVAGWLGISNVSKVLEEGAKGLEEYEQPRPQFLGLGAKFLSHNKAMALTSGVERQLGRRVLKSAEKNQGGNAFAPGKGGKPFAARQEKVPRHQQGSDSEEEGGRASAFAHKGSNQTNDTERDPGSGGDAAGSTRKGSLARDQLLSAPLQGVKKKKKKRKGGGHPEAGVS